MTQQKELNFIVKIAGQYVTMTTSQYETYLMYGLSIK